MLREFNNYLFYLVHTCCRNVPFDIFMPMLGEFGNPIFFIIVILILFLCEKKGTRRLWVLLLIGLIAACFFDFILKICVAQSFSSSPLVNLLAHPHHFRYTPSGHAMRAFMAATIFFSISKKFWYLFIIAFGVAFAKVYTHAHSPIDAITGSLIGVILGFLIMRAEKLLSSASE